MAGSTKLNLFVARLLDRVRYWFWDEPKPYRWLEVHDPPDNPAANIVYVVGEHGHLWSAEFVCPCGCAAHIRLSLHHDGRPRWSATLHENGFVSLHPSVWRRVGCRAHFSIRNGRIVHHEAVSFGAIAAESEPTEC